MLRSLLALLSISLCASLACVPDSGPVHSPRSPEQGAVGVPKLGTQPTPVNAREDAASSGVGTTDAAGSEDTGADTGASNDLSGIGFDLGL